jgi:hypothetical protein
MSEDEPRSTWGPREFPILSAALHRLDAGQDVAEFRDLQSDTGLSRDQLWTGLHALKTAQPPYLETQGWDVVTVHERARRELGTWPKPDSLVDAIADAYERAAEDEQEPEKKTRLRAVADGLRGAVRDIAVGVITKQLGEL